MKHNFSFLLAFLLMVTSPFSRGATFTVTTADSDGAGSLAVALGHVNTGGSGHSIVFDIGNGGPQTIVITSQLHIDNSVLIDGTTQPGYAGKPLITLRGPAGSMDGIVNNYAANIYGICINGFAGNGIVNYGFMTISNCYIGTDAEGLVAIPNQKHGIVFGPGAGGNIFNSIVSGNTFSGIYLDGAAASLITGNLIGMDATGMTRLPNQLDGIQIIDSPNNIVGGSISTSANVISGNGRDGIAISDGPSTGNSIKGNFIGVNKFGSNPIPNGRIGVFITALVGRSDYASGNFVGGTDIEEGNVISGNGLDGIQVFGGASNQIQGNQIGTDLAGENPIPNQRFGVLIEKGSYNIVGGPTVASRNLISGNVSSGIQINGGNSLFDRAQGNVITGNYIGTDINGVKAIPNGGSGVEIGTVPTGGEAIENVIGGMSPAPGQPPGNLIASNTVNGITVLGSGAQRNEIAGNIIRSNARVGILLDTSGPNDIGPIANLIGGGDPRRRNWIYAHLGPDGDGIRISSGSQSNIIQGNLIGTQSTGVGLIVEANYGHGVTIVNSSYNVIGTPINESVITFGQPGNFIAGNVGNGVTVTGSSSKGNTIRANAVYNNGKLGIDLGDDGVTLNDADGTDNDEGPNGLMNYPLSLTASFDINLNRTTITGILKTAKPETVVIDLYQNDVVDPSGFGEGAFYVGSKSPNRDGIFSFSVDGKLAHPELSATATDASGSTSEFAPAKRPLIFIPGMAGSVLVEDFPGTTEFWPGLENVYHILMSLYNFDQPFRKIHPADALRNVAGFKDFYGSFLQWLGQNGYNECILSEVTCPFEPHPTVAPNLFIYPYDWRKSNAENAARLTTLLPTIKQYYPGSSIDIVTHSMGGLLARRFLLINEAEADVSKKINVQRMVTVAAPWLGTPKLINSMETGDLDSFGQSLLILPSVMAYIIGSFDGAYELMPSLGYFAIGAGPVLSESGWNFNNNRESIEDYPSYQKTADEVNAHYSRDGKDRAGNANIFHGGAQDDWRDDNLPVEYFHIHGVRPGQDTIRGLEARSGVVMNPDFTVSIVINRFWPIYGEGDRTVARPSAERFNNGFNWNARNATVIRFDKFKDYNGDPDSLEHGGLLSKNSMVRETIKSILFDRVVAHGTIGFGPSALVHAKSATHDGSYYVTLLGKCSVVISNSFGATTAPPVGAPFLGEVPGVIIEQFDDKVKAFVIPATATHTLVLHTFSEPVVLEVLRGSGTNINSSVRYMEGAIPANIVGVIKLNPESTDNMIYDRNGDGVFDGSVTPTVSVSGLQAQDTIGPLVNLTSSLQSNLLHIELSATDPSGVMRLLCSTNGSNFFPYPGPFAVDVEVSSNLLVVADDLLLNRTVRTFPLLIPVDLGVSLGITPKPVALGIDLTLTVTVTNRSPNSARGVILSNTIPAGFTIDTITPSQGTFTASSNIVTCQLGSIPGRGFATVQMRLTPTSEGTFYASATVTEWNQELNSADNTASADIVVNHAPVFRISSSSFPIEVDEGNNVVITVSRVPVDSGTTSVDFATVSQTAWGGQDYIATNGTLVFLPGETEKSFTVQTLADAVDDPCETFSIVLSNPAAGSFLGEPANAVVRIRDPGGACLLVSTTNDSGPGSMRQAISDANATPGRDLITFAIPGAGSHRIRPLSPLPVITGPVTIDGYSQPGAMANSLPDGDNAVLKIEVDGGALGNAGLRNGLELRTTNCIIRGLVLNGFGPRFTNSIIITNLVGEDFSGVGLADFLPLNFGPGLVPGHALVLRGGGNHIVEGCFIGTDVTGTQQSDPGRTNDFQGIFLDNTVGVLITDASSGNRIGGTSPAARNVISDSLQGFKICCGASSNVVQGNFVGTDATGTQALRDRTLTGGGGPGEAGVDSRFAGIHLQGANWNLIGGAEPGARNLISGNYLHGISLFDQADNNTIQGNLIGSDITGQAILRSGYGNEFGILSVNSHSNTIGGSVVSARNLVSGNDSGGIVLFASHDNAVQNNFIGTDLAGTRTLHGLSVPFSNDGDGVVAGTIPASFCDRNLIISNVISGNLGNGLIIRGTGNRAIGNRIGTDVSGSYVIPNVGFDPLSSLVPGNGIWLDQAGDGIAPVLTNYNIVVGNQIGGNSGHGILVKCSGGNVLQGNLIGTTADGGGPLGNGHDGVRIEQCFLGGASDGNLIGGTNVGQGNIIAFNGGNGVGFAGGMGNAILGNAIHDNAGLGIDLGVDGVTLNDPGDTDGGPNGLVNFPVLQPIRRNAGTTTIEGSLDTVANSNIRVEVFTSNGADASGYGEGQSFLGVTGVRTDNNGHGSFSLILPMVLATNQLVTATATDEANNTSEFSQVPPDAIDLAVTMTDSADPAAVMSNLIYALTVANSGLATATGVILTSALPASVSFVSATASQGSCAQSGGVVSCQLGTMATGVVATVTILVTPSGSGVITNIATVSANELDYYRANNTAVQQTVVGFADLAVDVAASPDPTAVGQELTYTVTVRNFGPDSAVGAFLTNRLVDSVLANPSFAVSQGNITQGGSGAAWLIGNIPSGGNATLTITGIATNDFFGFIGDSAEVHAQNADPNPGNNRFTMFTEIEAPALVEFETAGGAVKTSAGSASVKILRRNSFVGQVTAQFSTVDDSAVAGRDYTATQGTVTFAEGEYEKSISIPLLQDPGAQCNKALGLTLTSPSLGAVLEGLNTFQLRIIDDRAIRAGVVQVVSVADTNALGVIGTTGNSGSYQPVLSSNGRFVAFYSLASDLVPGDANNQYDVFVRDLKSGATELVSVAASGGGSGNNFSASRAISADGRFVLFYSIATDLVTNATVSGKGDLYIRDLVAGTTVLLSVSSDGTTGGDEASYGGVFSANARYVAFVSDASNLVTNDANAATDVFVRDLVAGTTTLVSVNGQGNGSGNGGSWEVALSADGRLAAFSSDARDLVSNDSNNQTDVFIRDLINHTTEMVSVNQTGTDGGNGPSYGVLTSSDGRYVAFYSEADDLAEGDNNEAGDAFVRDRATRTTRLVSANGAGTGSGNDYSYPDDMTPDGRYVVFESIATDLVINDVNGLSYDVFVRDLQTETTTLVSATCDGVSTGGGDSESGVISADGQFVAFFSRATNLVGGQFVSPQRNLFRRNLREGSTVLLTRKADGSGASEFFSQTAQISADGNTVAFSSDGDDLTLGDNNFQKDVFAWLATCDLSLRIVGLPNPITLGNLLTYQVTVSNAGPEMATGIIVTNLLSAGQILIAVGNGSNSTANVCPFPGPVAWWQGEGNASDATGGPDGSLHGVTFAPGEVGLAFGLDGLNAYVNVPDSPRLRPESLTLEGWIRIQDSSGVHTIVSKSLGSGGSSSYAIWLASGVLQAGISDSSGPGPVLSYPEFTGPQSLFDTNISDLPSLAAKLRLPAISDSVSAFLKSQLSTRALGLLSNYAGGQDQPLATALVSDLNRVVRGGSLYDPQRFANVQLGGDTVYELNRSPSGSDLVRLNLFLLRDAYSLDLNLDPFPQSHRWVHVAYTYDRLTHAQALYVDGGLVDSGLVNKVISYDNHDLLIGASGGGGMPGDFYQGQIDELTLYDRALTGTEILGIRNAGALGKCPSAGSFVLADLDRGASETLSLAVVPTNCVTLSATATVLSRTLDLATNNNAASVLVPAQDVAIEDFRVSIQRISANNNALEICWPATCGAVALMGTTDLTPPVTWTQMLLPPQLIGAYYCVAIPASSGMQYYRLERR